MSDRNLHLLGATGRPRVELLDGREHLVVPVIALLEGVIHAINAETPEYVPISALSNKPERWDGHPVVLNHPAKNGVQISAKEPGVLDAQGLGTILKTCVKNGRLCLEAWIDPAKAKKTDKGVRLLERINNGEQIEVSVGAYVNTLKNAGVYNGRPYKAVWQDIVPDHLAFLPDGIGACSIAMGCGAHRAATAHFVTAEGIEALSKKRYKKVAEALNANLEDDDDEDDENIDIKNAASKCGCKGEPDMKTKAERIAALVAHAHNDVKDIKILEAACENTLTALEAAATAKEDAAKAGADLKAAQDALAAKDAELKAASSRKITRDEIMAAEPEIANIVNSHNARVAAEKDALVAKLKTASSGVYTEDELKAMSVESLNKLAALAKVEPAAADTSFVAATRALTTEEQKTFTPPDPWAAGIKTLQESTKH